MAKKLLSAILIGLTTAGMGCVAVLGNRIPADCCASRQAIVVDGSVYIVDLHSGKVRKAAPATIEQAETIEYHEVQTTQTSN